METYNVTINICGLVNNSSGHAQKHALQNGDQSNQANEQDADGNEKHNTTRDFVILGICILLEKGRAFASLFVAGNKTDLRARGISGLPWFADDGIKTVTRRAGCFSFRNVFDKVLVRLDDSVPKRRYELLDRAFPLKNNEASMTS